jgi:hypothetical protein
VRRLSNTYLPETVSNRNVTESVKCVNPQATIKTLDVAVLLRLARGDVVPLDPPVLRPAQDRQAGQLGPVIAHDHQRPAANRNDRIELER